MAKRKISNPCKFIFLWTNLLLNGTTGFLVDEGDINGMAEYIVMIANEPELASRLGKAGSEKINSTYTVGKNIEKVTEVIEKLLAQKTF